MNRFFLILIISIASPCGINAQFGFKAGVNLSYISGNGDLASNRVSKFGFQGGVMVRIPVKEDWLFVQPELIYIQKGGAFDIGTINFDANLDYIELPVLAGINLLGGVLNFHAGPQFSFLTKVAYTGADGNNPSNSFKNTDLSNYNSFDIGLAIGTGIELEIVMIELRYSIGFLAVEKDFSYNGQQYDPSSKNFNVQLWVGYLF